MNTPGGTRTVPPPFAAQASIESWSALVFIVVPSPTAPKSKIRYGLGWAHVCNPNCEEDFAVMFYGAGVECGVDADTFHQERVGIIAEVVTPWNWRVFCGDDGVNVT
jgi:hypothetical protein